MYIQESLVQYERDLHKWEEEKERQPVEFTITEKDLGTKKKLMSPSVVSALKTLHQLSLARETAASVDKKHSLGKARQVVKEDMRLWSVKDLKADLWLAENEISFSSQESSYKLWNC